MMNFLRTLKVEELNEIAGGMRGLFLFGEDEDNLPVANGIGAHGGYKKDEDPVPGLRKGDDLPVPNEIGTRW